MEEIRPAVEVFTFRPFTVHINGAPLTFAVKAQRKPLALLKVLIALGAENVAEISLADALWPDADGDSAHENFKSTLRRLRRLLGAETLRFRDGRLSIVREKCWVDGTAVASEMALVESAGTQGNCESENRHLQRALNIYRSPFLEGEFDPPEILVARERFHSRLLRNVTACGKRLIAAGRFEDAASLLRTAIEVDGVAEELHQELIRCLNAQGLSAAAIAAYERCRMLLREGAGIDPSPETERLRAALAFQAVPAAAPTSGPVAPIAVSQDASAETREPQPERRRLAVLVIRAAGDSPEPAAARDPETVEASRESLRAAVAEAVKAHGGGVNQFLPDGGLALFGWPAAHEDDAVRAVRAARAIAAGPWRPRTAVATGLTVLHPAGRPDGMVRVAGQPVEEAARLAGRAPAGEVWVDAATVPAVAGYFRTRFAGGRRGKNGAPAYRVTASTPARTPLEAARQRGFSPFVGRGEELRRLEEALARALAGQAQFVTVAGEAGIGKSRLIHEFRQRIDRGRVTVLEGRCQSHGGGTPYLPLLDALRRGLRLSESDPPETLRRKAISNVLAADPGLERYLPLYLHLLSIPSAEHPLPPNLQGDALRLAFEEALAALVTASAVRRPLVLIYEDWHWADEASESALRHLLRAATGHALMIVAAHRPDYSPRWGNVAHHLPLALPRLSSEDAAGILRFRLGAEKVSGDLASMVYERTGGNPFFVEEMSQSLRAEGAVRVAGGEAGLARALEATHLPALVEAVVRSRMDRMDPDAQEALRWAAVVGREIPRPVLERVYGGAEPLPAVLDRLAAEEFIQPVHLLPEPEHRFKHVLAQAAVYEILVQAERKRRHAAVGAALEQVYAGRLEEHYEALAHHYSHSDDVEKAVDYLEKAGDKAVSVFSLRQARAHYQRALEHIDALPSMRLRKLQRAGLCLKLAQASYLGGYSLQVIDALTLSLKDAIELEADRETAWISFWIARIHYILGHHQKSLAHFSHCIEIAEKLRDETLLGQSQAMLGRPLFYLGQYGDSIHRLTRGTTLLRKHKLRGELVRTWSFRGIVHMWLGDYHSAVESLSQAACIASESDDTRSIVFSEIIRGTALSVSGHWDESLKAITKGIALAQDVGELILLGLGLVISGRAVFHLNSPPEGIKLMAGGFRMLEQSGTRLMMTYVCGWLAEAYALAGQVQKARSFIRKAFHNARLGERHGETIVHRAVGISAVTRGLTPWNNAQAAMEESIRLADDQGLLPELALSHLRFAELLHQHGDSVAAHHHVNKAAAHFTDAKMGWWLDRASDLRGRIENGEPFRGFVPFVQREQLEGSPRLTSRSS